MARYLSRLEDELSRNGMERSLLVMQGNAGTMTAKVAADHAAQTVMSGPAAGALAAAHVGIESGIRNVIACDMGGTSFDVSLIKDGETRARLFDQLREAPPGYGLMPDDPNVVRIRLRYGPFDPPVEIKEEDIILTSGDVLFIEGRDREVFYTGGLLGGGEHLLPRDYDLDVVAAVSVAKGVTTGPGSGQGQGGGAFFGGGGGSVGAIEKVTVTSRPAVPVQWIVAEAASSTSIRSIASGSSAVRVRAAPARRWYEASRATLSANSESACASSQSLSRATSRGANASSSSLDGSGADGTNP